MNSWTIPAVQLSETSKVQSEMEISLPSLNLKEKPDVLDKNLNHVVNRDLNRGQTFRPLFDVPIIHEAVT